MIKTHQFDQIASKNQDEKDDKSILIIILIIMIYFQE
jgi:hypothetical protein